MNAFTVVGGLIVMIVCGLVGAQIGRQRGRETAGFFLGIFLGPIGCLAALFLPKD